MGTEPFTLLLPKYDLGEGIKEGDTFWVGDREFRVMAIRAGDIVYSLETGDRFTPGQCYSNDTEDIIDLRDFLDEA